MKINWVHDTLLVNRNDGAIMRNISTFEKEEYQKLIDTLGLSDNRPDENDFADYFNAWNFGQTEKDFDFCISSSLNNL